MNIVTELKEQRRPIIDPLLSMLRSRKILLLLAAVIVNLAIEVVPFLSSISPELKTLITGAFLSAAGYYTLEDAIVVARGPSVKDQQPTDSSTAIRQLILEATNILFTSDNGLDNEQVNTVKKTLNDVGTKILISENTPTADG